MITLIIGASRSGTSMLAQLCQDNAAWMGDVTGKEYDPKAGYDQCENRRFRQLCRNKLLIDNDLAASDLHQCFVEFFESLPDETIVLKYPKAFYILDYLGTLATFKLVFVIRNPWLRSLSYMDKDGGSFSRGLYEWEQAYSAVINAAMPSHIAIFERFFTHPQDEAARMLDFIGLPTTDISCIDSQKRHY